MRVSLQTGPLLAAVLATAMLTWPPVFGHTAAQSTDVQAVVRDALRASAGPAQASAAARLATHPDYRPARLSEWLHRAWEYPVMAPGAATLDVALDPEGTRRVHLILPAGYRSDRAWPLVYALHPSGMGGQEWAGRVQRVLGRRASEFVIAAPDAYRQNYLAASPPFVAEHPAILDAVARRVHVDANRVYAFGYSKGGFGAWFVALYYPDRLAGAIAWAAGFDVTIDDGGFWKQLVPNVAHLPVYNAWGARDALVARSLNDTPVGTFAEDNRRFAKGIFGMGLPITNIEVPGGGHNDMVPPLDPMVTILDTGRFTGPRRVAQTFRHLHQASCYWLEGLSWIGDHWGAKLPDSPPAPGDTAERRLTRAIEPLLARLEGVIDGQTVRVTRRHIGDVAVWFSEKTIDWEKPVRIEVDGRVVFEGRLARDPGVAVARAAATMDFDHLRWAGVRVTADGAARVVTPDDVPGPAWRLK